MILIGRRQSCRKTEIHLDLQLRRRFGHIVIDIDDDRLFVAVGMTGGRGNGLVAETLSRRQEAMKSLAHIVQGLGVVVVVKRAKRGSARALSRRRSKCRFGVARRSKDLIGPLNTGETTGTDGGGGTSRRGKRGFERRVIGRVILVLAFLIAIVVVRRVTTNTGPTQSLVVFPEDLERGP